MAEYIDKQAALRHWPPCDKPADAYLYIKSFPATDVRPVVHGHWVYEEPNGANSFKGAYWCDQCHQPEPYRKNFCPNCGADMR